MAGVDLFSYAGWPALLLPVAGGGACGALGASLAARLSAGPGGLAGAAACGALLALPAALLLPPAAWPTAAVFGTLLFAIAWLDLRTGLVHAALAGPLSLLGLLHGAVGKALPAAAAGAALGYLLCRAVEYGYSRLRGREGLGRGDAWVLGAAGTWVGPGGLGLTLALAAGAALLTVLARDGRLDRETSLPFAPALAAGAWFTWIAAGGTTGWGAP